MQPVNDWMHCVTVEDCFWTLFYKSIYFATWLSFYLLIDSFIHSLIDWLIDWLVDWLIDWLIDILIWSFIAIHRDSQQPKLESEINYWDNNQEEEGDDDEEEDASSYTDERYLKKVPRNNLKNNSEESSSRSASSKSFNHSSSSSYSASNSHHKSSSSRPNPCAPSATLEGHVRQVVSSQGCSRVFIVKGKLVRYVSSPFSSSFSFNLFLIILNNSYLFLMSCKAILYSILGYSYLFLI